MHASHTYMHVMGDGFEKGLDLGYLDVGEKWEYSNVFFYKNMKISNDGT